MHLVKEFSHHDDRAQCYAFVDKTEMEAFISFDTWADLIILDMTNFDIILGMNCLSSYYVFLNCNTKSLTLEILGTEKLEWEWIYKCKQTKIIPFINAIKLAKWGSFAHI